MVLCALGGWVMAHSDRAQAVDAAAHWPLLGAATLTAIVGGALVRIGRGEPGRTMNRREATLVVALIWAGTGVFGALPFYFGAGMQPIDAFFEAVSGFTTTGATVLVAIEPLSKGTLLWRSVIQWLGGMGIVVLFVAVFPNIGVGGKHLFRFEVPGPAAEGLQPRIAETSTTLWRLYAGLTVILVGLLWLLGMDLFDAVCHAFTTMSTGGFSVYDNSIAAFRDVAVLDPGTGAWRAPAIEMTLTVFMLIAGVNFSLYFVALKRRTLKYFWRSTEFRAYLGIVALCTAVLTVTTLGVDGRSMFEAFRHAFFMVGTTVTSTGFGTDDWWRVDGGGSLVYPSVSLVIVLLLMLAGGSAGSTAGGIKLFRIVLLTKMAWAHIRRSFRPSVIQVVRMETKSVETSILNEVAALLLVYLAALALGTVAVAATEQVPPQTAFGAMVTCLSNMGPGPFHVGADNFASYSYFAKILFSLSMVLGRLEFFALLSLLLPDFWRR